MVWLSGLSAKRTDALELLRRRQCVVMLVDVERKKRQQQWVAVMVHNVDKFSFMYYLEFCIREQIHPNQDDTTGKGAKNNTTK